MAHDVFISHAHADKTIADMVCATLEQHGIRCWIAPRDIQPGTDWGAAIIGAIRESRGMVLVFSNQANASRHIPRELERAIDGGIPIIPFRIENVSPSDSLAYGLSSVHWLDAVTPPIEAHLRQLATTVRAMLGASPVPAEGAAGLVVFRIPNAPVTPAKEEPEAHPSDALPPSPDPVISDTTAAAPRKIAIAWFGAILLLAGVAGLGVWLYRGASAGPQQETVPPATAAAPIAAPSVASPPAMEARAGVTPPSNPAKGDRWTSADGRKMVWIPPGSFLMGSPDTERGRDDDESPRHQVLAERGFWLDATEVTNAAYQRFIQANPKWQKGNADPKLQDDANYLSDWDGTSPPADKAQHPVDAASWYAAQAYCSWAAKRLPTEAEWEYAARAGTSTAYWWGDQFVRANAHINSSTGAVAVGAPSRTNPWGLSDMLGNLSEWTSSEKKPYPYLLTDGREETFAGSRVLRGGSWVDAAKDARSAARASIDPGGAAGWAGFRCAR